jgi:transcriptional regulator with XRE-family HTH domain
VKLQDVFLLGRQADVQRPDPPALRWLIGTELRKYRHKAGLTLAGVALHLGVTSGMIGHYENGRYTPQPGQLAMLLRLYGVQRWDVDRLSSLVGRLGQRSWLARWSDVIPDWLRTYVGLEGLTSHMVWYAPLVLPALLQTEAYSIGVIESSLRVRPDQVERIVRLRMERQQRLVAGTDPLRLTAFIEESILDRPIGGPNVMHEQLDHLLELSERDNIEILVLPTAIGRHGGLTGQFRVLHFERAQSIGYVEYLDGAVYVQDQGQVVAYTRTAESLRSVALPKPESVRLIAGRRDAYI